MTVIRRHPIGAFLAAAYGLAVLIYALPVLGTAGLGVIAAEIPLAPFLLLSTVMLAGVAFAVTATADGRVGVRELRSRAFRFRVSPLWYAVALLLLPLAALATAVVLNGAAPLNAFGREPGNHLVGWVSNIALAVVLIQLWEEIGWTGFVLHRLQGRYGPLAATVLTGWAQATIHLPLLFVAGGLGEGRITPDQYPTYLAALYILPLSSRTILTWLYNRSGQSVPASALLHSTWNLVTGLAFLPALVPGFSEVWAYAGFAAVAVALIVATRGRLGYQGPVRGEHRAAAPALRSAGVATR